MKYFDRLDLIDSILHGPASTHTWSELLALIDGDASAAAYAMRNLESSDWLVVANLKDVSSLIVGDNRVSSGFAQYLIKCAERGELKQHDVLVKLKALRGLADTPVRFELARAAAFLEPSSSAEWATQEAKWLQSLDRLDDTVCDPHRMLIKQLAERGHADAALGLAAALLDVLPDPAADLKRNRVDQGNPTAQYVFPRPHARLDEHEYRDVLRDILPYLLAAAPEKTFEMLSDLTEKAMVYGLRDPASEKPNDLSIVRRPAIEDHEQNKDYHFEHHLISAWRDAAEHLAGKYPDRVPDMVSALEAREWNLFRRLALHLLRVAPRPSMDLIETRLTDADLFHKSGLHHEFWGLLEARFQDLTAEGQARVLERIEEEGKQTGDDKEDRIRRYSQYRWLLAIESHLEETRVARLASLRNEFGQPSMPPDFLTWTGGVEFIEPSSPLTQEDIASLPIAKLVTYLRDWKPSGDWRSPTAGGLGAQLTVLVQGAPEKWADNLNYFQDCSIDCTYHRHLLSGFVAVVESGKSIPWAPVLAFAEWIADLPLVPHEYSFSDEQRGDLGLDRNRASAQMEVARLLVKGFNAKGSAALSFDLRSAGWRIVERLADSEDPSPEVEAKSLNAPGTFDPLTKAINTVRGEGLSAVMEYAGWVSRHLDPGGDRPAACKPSWSDFPEIQPVIESRFHDGPAGFSWSIVDRAVLGRWLPQLVRIDAQWVRGHLVGLFPQEPEKAARGKATWDTFLRCNPAFNAVYDVIREEYFDQTRALAASAGSDEDKDIRNNLASHVLALYVWGRISLDADDLVDVFFRAAGSDVTGSMLESVGRVLSREKDLKPAFLERLKAMWDWRVQTIGGLESMPEAELMAFGFWFASGCFDLDWCFRYLPATLRIDKKHWGQIQVLEQLAAAFESKPAETLRCLEIMVQRAGDLWLFQPREDGSAWKILDSALGHADPRIAQKADEITNTLGQKRHLGYRALRRKHSIGRKELNK
ncbi:MAG: hypothetical protein K9N49_02290 [Candidatus Marinimicrobia bacterium]|nr:hypothetical protein [Candidatus Neomarinimicrobiota bacterium]